ncbi:hypothetical protein D9M72_515070 [compost metagenome]
MRDALPGRHPQQPARPRDWPREKLAKHIHRPLRLRQGPTQPVQRLQLACPQVVDAGVQPAEWLVVGRQHQHIVRHGRPDLVQRRQPVFHGIRIRFGRKHRHIGRDPGQDLVAGDEQLQ